MDEIKKVSISAKDFIKLLETDVRQRVLKDFLKNHEYVSREDILCILGLLHKEKTDER